MPTVTLPDGSQRTFAHPVTVLDVAKSIGAGLARAALAARVDDRLVDTSFVIDDDVSLALLTAEHPDGLEVIRHSTAHLLAQAVKSLFPSAQVTIGPVIEDGFYYDFAFERSFTTEDLAAIESRMAEIARQDLVVERQVLPRDEAAAFFEAQGEHYKAAIIRDIPAGEQISLYSQGDFIDLCRGPHVPNTGRLKAFRLTKVAGAYWRGDSRNQMLQRIYGTSWASKDELDAYLKRLEEAEKRDHRKLGRQLNLFHFQEEAPGMAFWHERGWMLWQQIEQYLRHVLRRHGYREVRCPQILDSDLWKRSGHWENFRENMFVTDAEEREFAVKPMNCPGHVQIFNQGLKSYRDLPLRLAEFGACHRNEPSGALHGLMRVRAFTQDDAHIFCTEDQIQEEVSGFIELLSSVYLDFGFPEVDVKLSTRPLKRVGSDETWDKAETALQRALDARQMNWQLQPGEGAFYGPKIEFALRDSLGRSWQCGTIQLDFSLPVRLGACYVAEDNVRKAPVMLHRAILGSMERFIGILLEHYAGQLPVWLSPVQAVVMSITERFVEYAAIVAESLENQGFRAIADLRNEKIGLKIREHSLHKIPYLLVIGEREVEQRTVAVRAQNGTDLGSKTLAELCALLTEQVIHRARPN